MKKKILIYANYFYPEVASTAQILTELAVELQKEFEVTVICSVPCYTGKIEEKYQTKKYFYEEYNEIKMIRVRVPEFKKTSKKSRVFHILSYFFHSIFATFKVGKQDVVFTISQPPILGGMLGCFGKIVTKGKLIYNIQDFNPEQTIAVGYSKNKLLLKLMMAIDKYSCKKSDLIITVGSDMQKTLENRFKGKKVPHNIVINNWMNEHEIYPLAKTDKNVQAFRKQYQLENKFVIMYSGNIGLYYDLQNLIRIIKKFQNEKNVVFAFVGDGNMKPTLEQIVKEEHISNVVFIPYQDKKDLVYSLNAADVQFVTNAKGIKGVSVPSKIYGVMAANIPVFGILEKNSEAWNIVLESGCGILSTSGNDKEILKNLELVIQEKEKFVKRHETGRSYLEEHFTKEKSIVKYKKAIYDLVGD